MDLDGERRRMTRYRPVASWHGKIDRTQNLSAIGSYFDRLDYVAPMNQEHAFALAVERMLGLDGRGGANISAFFIARLAHSESSSEHHNTSP